MKKGIQQLKIHKYEPLPMEGTVVNYSVENTLCQGTTTAFLYY